MAIAGHNLVVKVGTASNGPFTAVADLREASMSQSGNNIDVSTLDVAWMRRIQGMKDATYSLSGFYNAADTAGQGAVRQAWADGSALYVQFLPDGTDGFQQAVQVSSIEVSASADGAQEVSIELEGDGIITPVT